MSRHRSKVIVEEIENDRVVVRIECEACGTTTVEMHRIHLRTFAMVCGDVSARIGIITEGHTTHLASSTNADEAYAEAQRKLTDMELDAIDVDPKKVH